MKQRHLTLITHLCALFVFSLIVDACIIVPPPHPPPHPHPYPKPWPVEFPLQTKRHAAEVTIRDNIATTRVLATFHNRSAVRMEGEYLFPVQRDAVVTEFSMTANGKTLSGELLPADEARALYEETVRNLKDPGLLEFLDTGVIRARVYPIEPHADVTIELSYAEVLEGDRGTFHYHYPARSAIPPKTAGGIGQLVMTIDLVAQTPIQTAYSPTYEFEMDDVSSTHVLSSFEKSSFTPESNVDFYYCLKEQPVGMHLLSYSSSDREDGFFYLTVSPPDVDENSTVIPKDVLFVLDTSGSMAGRKIDQAKNALRFCLSSLDSHDRFNVLTFSTTVKPLWDRLIDASESSIDETTQRIHDAKATGGTALYDAVSLALSQEFRSDRLGLVLFLTDGLPTVGTSNVGDILSLVDTANASETRFFVFGVGDDLNTELLDGLARRTRGSREYVAESEDIEVKVSTLYRKISSPVLTDLVLDLGASGGYDIYPEPLPDLFAGEDLVILGRYRQGGATRIALHGRQGDQSRKVETAVDFLNATESGFIPRMWAGAKIVYLLEQIRTNGPLDELVDAVTELGEHYGIVTPYTSLLVLEDERLAGDIGATFNGARRRLEESKVGAGAVDASKMVASLPMGRGGRVASPPSAILPESVREADAQRFLDFERGLEEHVKHVRDKTFYVDEHGVWVDSEYDLAVHGERVEEIELFSEEYFNLLASSPGSSKYLAAHSDMILVLDERVVKIISS